MMNALHIVVLS